MPDRYINEDMADAKKVLQDSWHRAYNVQNNRNTIYQRLWQRYKGYNPNISHPYRSNLIMPKLYTMVETIGPRLGKALFGRRPYMPIKSEADSEGARLIEAALDAYLYRDRFKVKGKLAIKGITLFGTFFLEPYPELDTVIYRKRQKMETYPWAYVTIEERVKRFRMKTQLWAPWQVYIEPRMMSFDDPGFAIVVDLVHRSEILRLQQKQRYFDFDIDRLAKMNLQRGGGIDSDKNFAGKMMSSIGIALPSQDSEYGVRLRYMSRDRYITMWNGVDILEDGENPFQHRRINLARMACNLDPMLQNSFWGQPEGKSIEPILDKLDETWNMTFDNHDQINQGVIGYREDAVEPESIVMVGGARIGVKSMFQGSIRDAIDILETRDLPADHYNIPAVLDHEIDRASGVYEMQRGEPRQHREMTATESSILFGQGDLRNEDRADIIESLGFSEFADLATSHLDEFGDMASLIEAVGPEMLMAATMNPYNLPGNFDYQFKGADSVVNDFQRRADWREILQIAIADPTSRPGEVLRQTYRLYGYSEQEINKLVLTQEEIAMMMQAQREEEEDAEMRQLGADVVRAEVGASAKARAQENKPKGVADKKKQRAAQVPTVANPTGTY